MTRLIKHIPTILFGILAMTSVKAQKIAELPKTRLVVINYEDSVVQANVLTDSKKYTPDESKIYYWYYANKIGCNKGDYYGKLLYGDYVVLNRKNDLQTKGVFKHGLKTGTWKKWYVNGNIKEKSKWKKGTLTASRFFYNENGTVCKIEYFRNGRIYKQKVFKDNYYTIQRFKKQKIKELPKPPKEKTDKTKRRFFKKPLFKEKNKSETSKDSIHNKTKKPFKLFKTKEKQNEPKDSIRKYSIKPFTLFKSKRKHETSAKLPSQPILRANEVNKTEY